MKESVSDHPTRFNSQLEETQTRHPDLDCGQTTFWSWVCVIFFRKLTDELNLLELLKTPFLVKEIEKVRFAEYTH